jgi:outer membrane protein assembly factor BamB
MLDGAAYAEPLLYSGTLFVATENNSVYALNASTGLLLWRDNFGAPVPGSALPCGDIDPSGITGTPVIDPGAGTLYAVAYLNPTHHVLYAVSTRDGSVRFSETVDPPGAEVPTQQERAALTLANGMVYIPFGGLDGDCGNYHGWVVGVRADGSPGLTTYVVPTNREGGIWTPSGAAVDSAGDLYVATGNGDSTSAFDHGDSVIGLTPSLTELSYFAPTDWAALNGLDLDLGTVGPTLIGSSTVFQVGKGGVGYLLNASDLGGIGGQEASLHVCGSAYGATAFDGTYVYVACTDGLVQVNVAGGTLNLGWDASGFQAGPPVVAGGVVWTVDAPSGRLLGYSVANGSRVFSFQIGGTSRFTTPTVGPSAVYVATDGYVYAFGTG